MNGDNDLTNPKKRKVTQGPIRDKERTMRKLVNAVGSVLKRKGYTGLTVANIATAAKVDRKLIYFYFDNVDNLIEIYIKQRDFWQTVGANDIDKIFTKGDQTEAKDIYSLLKYQFQHLSQDISLQKIMLWELSEPGKSLLKVAQDREVIGKKLFKSVSNIFEDADLDIHALFALLVGGIYFLPLHAASTGKKFCEIDMNEEQGKQRIMDAIEYFVSFVFSKGKNNTSDL